jgi:hypothetical protein
MTGRDSARPGLDLLGLDFVGVARPPDRQQLAVDGPCQPDPRGLAENATLTAGRGILEISLAETLERRDVRLPQRDSH